MADYLPVYVGAQPFTSTASAAVTGGQVLEATTTGAVGPAGAASLKVVGVAAHDAAIGAKVTVFPVHGNVHETTTPAGATVGATLAAAAAGTVDPGTTGTLAAAGSDIGVALTTASAAAKVRWTGR